MVPNDASVAQRTRNSRRTRRPVKEIRSITSALSFPIDIAYQRVASPVKQKARLGLPSRARCRSILMQACRARPNQSGHNCPNDDGLSTCVGEGVKEKEGGMGVAEKGSRGDGEGEKAGSRTRAMYFVYRISPDEERTTSDESHDAGYPGRKGRFYIQAELRIVALFATHAAYGTEAHLERVDRRKKSGSRH